MEAEDKKIEFFNCLNLDIITGIPEIDEQHEELIDKLSELNNMLVSGVNYNDLRVFLDYLENYAALHFINEENYMEEYKYNEIEEHKEQHKEFYRYYNSFKNLIKENAEIDIILNELHTGMLKWLETHLREYDSKLASFFIKIDIFDL